MGQLRCVDGSVLSVQAVACRDSAGRPYEITLRLARNSVPFAAVGQRCGYQFSELAERVSAARLDPEQAAAWPDPDDRFPGARGGPEAGCLPGEHEYFTLRSRDRSDLPGAGELRCVLRSTAVWHGECPGTGHHRDATSHLHQGQHGQHGQQGQHGAHGFAGHEPLLQNALLQNAQLQNAEPQGGGVAQAPGPQAVPGQRISPARRPAGGPGRWHLTRRAFIEAWGDDGVGVRAVLTSAELVAFLDTVLREPENPESAGAGAAGSVPAAGRPVNGPAVAGVPADTAVNQTLAADGLAVTKPPGGTAVLLRWQRGRVPDGIARSRLPAL
ncbi:MAG TPA: hypothetical protein VMA72_20960 [Streptosporangiaceae bacterium]|nr:hypothetical protein [Streptosporangiaceae bacterium]